MFHNADSEQTGMQGAVCSYQRGQEGHPNDVCLSTRVRLFIFLCHKDRTLGPQCHILPLYQYGVCGVLSDKALVRLVLGDRKHNARRAQVPYLFLESVYLRVPLACISSGKHK